MGFSDHRVLYIDIDMGVLLGKHKNSTTAHKIRRLQCADPRTVDAFNVCLEKQYKHHNVQQKLLEAEAALLLEVNPVNIEKLVKIDRINTQLIIYAEKSVESFTWVLDRIPLT